MIAIKGIKMPKSCYDCDFCCVKDDYYCAISKKRLARKVIDIPNENRSSDCPLVEIVTCKDCKSNKNNTCMKPSGFGFGVADDYFCASAFCVSAKGESELWD